MVWLYPRKHKSISRNARFSKYSKVQDSKLLALQQLKKSVRQTQKTRFVYRIVTKTYPNFEVCHGDNLEQIMTREWAYIKDVLPSKMPQLNSTRSTFIWLLAHFTQLAVEDGDTGEGEVGFEAEPSAAELSELPMDSPRNGLAGGASRPGDLDVDVGKEDVRTSSRDAKEPRRERDQGTPANSSPRSGARRGGGERGEESDGSGGGGDGDAQMPRSGLRHRRDRSKARTEQQQQQQQQQQPPPPPPSTTTTPRSPSLASSSTTTHSPLSSRDRRRDRSTSSSSSSSVLCPNCSSPSHLLPRTLFARLNVSAPALMCISLVVLYLDAPTILRWLPGRVVTALNVLIHLTLLALFFWPSLLPSLSAPACLVPLTASSSIHITGVGGAAKKRRRVRLRTMSSARQSTTSTAVGGQTQLDHPYMGDQEPAETDGDLTDGDENGVLERLKLSSVPEVPQDKALLHEHEHSWSDVPGETFNVRTGPEYKKNKIKALSDVGFYEVKAFDLFESNLKVSHIARHLDLPRHPLQTDDNDDPGELNVKGVPPWLLINFQIPTYAPASAVSSSLYYFSKPTEDGPTVNLVALAAITAEARQQIQEGKIPAARLLEAFMSEAADKVMRGRLKMIARLQNLEEANLGALVARYNAKPILVAPQQLFFKTQAYMEIDVDVHRFCYIARRAVHSFIPRMAHIVAELALVVEGRSDEELPEKLLGAVSINRLDLVDRARHFSDRRFKIKDYDDQQTPNKDAASAGAERGK